MNILLVTPLYSQHFDAGHFWLRALNQLGHTVIVWDYRLDRHDPNPPMNSFRFDLTLVMKGESVTPDYLKNCSKKVFCYWPDKFERDPGIEELLKGYDKVFTPVYPCPDWMEWLPTGWDPAIHRNHNMERKVPSLYVGTNNSKYKFDMVRNISPRYVAGNNWPSTWGLPPLYLHELVQAFNNTKVLVDIHQSPDAGVNRKFFEMIACGFTIIDNVPGIANILGDELSRKVCYNYIADARYLIDRYLTESEEREELWKQEREAIKNYTYLEAAKKVLSSLK